MPSTSMPRAAMSVATSTSASPERNASRVRVRWLWALSPWMACAGIPSRRRNVTSLSAPYFVRVNTSVWPAGLAWRMRASTPRFWSLSTATITCSIPSAGVARRPISTEAWPSSARRASASTSGDTVAENSIVWRCSGSAARMRRTSGANPMSSMRFAPDVRRILAALPEQRQTMLFSATVSPEVDALARRALDGHASVEIGRRATPAEGIEHVIVAVDKLQKRGVLAKILLAKPAGQTLVFTRTKYGADKLVTFLRKEGIPAHAIHGDKAQSHRTRTLDAFRSGAADVLVATDLAARGIDVDGIRMVVNFDVPNDPEVYVHRVGRTARAGARGLALTLLSPDEWLLMGDIEKLVGQVFPREVIPGFEPSVPPLQPRALKLEPARPARSVRARVGGRRRR